MKFKFERIVIWQKSMDFGEKIYSSTLDFPKFELYGLTSQLRRAVDSIALNIPEGQSVSRLQSSVDSWGIQFAHQRKSLHVFIRHEIESIFLNQSLVISILNHLN